jgi:hypothetical protein
MSHRNGGGHAPWPGPRLAAAAGLIGPLYLGGTILTLTLRQGAFLRTLGWDPLRAPTLDWPSGLALSPEGGWMIAAFLISGGLLAVFAAGLDHHLARSGPLQSVDYETPADRPSATASARRPYATNSSTT